MKQQCFTNSHLRVENILLPNVRFFHFEKPVANQCLAIHVHLEREWKKKIKRERENYIERYEEPIANECLAIDM